MGFFSDLKEDLSQAVDELMPNEGGAAAGGNHMMSQEEIMAAFAAAAAAEESAGQPAEEAVADEVPEGEKSDISDISLEEMLKNIDNIAFPEMAEPAAEAVEQVPEAVESVPEQAEPVGEAAEFSAYDPGAAADAGIRVPEDVTDDGLTSEGQSLEEMLAAAIAALPEQEEETVVEPLTAEPAMEETAAEELTIPEELPAAEFAGAEDVEVAEMSGSMDIAEQTDALSEEEGVTIYETLSPEEPVPEELVIEEPVIEETQPVDSFHAELMADIPLFDETLKEETLKEEALKEEAKASVPGKAPEAPSTVVKPELTPAPELDIEKTTKEMTYVAEGTSVIAAGMHICGDLLADAPVSVMGTIEGNVEVNGKLSVGGQIHGNVRAAEIYAEGAKLTGDIVSEGAVKLGARSVVMGNILANSAAIAGAVKGDIDVHGPIILDSTAIVVGNIKFKSIQINNGAVIEGMCLQCYADINPTSFFDAV